MRLTLVVLLASACGGREGEATPDAPALVPAQALVDVAVEAECARLAGGDPPSAIDGYLEAALRKRALTRAEIDEAARRHDVAATVEAKIGDCRRAAGWTPRAYDGGLLWEKLPPPSLDASIR